MTPTNGDLVLTSELIADGGAAHRIAGMLRSRRVRGVRPLAALLHGWSTWAEGSALGEGLCLKVSDALAAVFWIEPDAFNSECFGTSVGRVHWRLDRCLVDDDACANSVGNELRAAFLRSSFELLSCRTVGHDPLAVCAFQRAGCRFIGTNLWLHRPASLPVPRSLPDGVTVELRSLSTDSLSRPVLDDFMELAARCVFADRFALDVRIPRVDAEKRFLRIIENGLTGEIADYLAIMTSQGRPVGFGFFGASMTEPLCAGRWLTVLLDPHHRGRGMAEALVASAIALHRGGAAHWTCSHSAQNFDSAEVARRLGFRPGAIVHDFHWWKGEQKCER